MSAVLALGLIEVRGFVAAIAAADAATKAADIVVEGLELTRGGGLVLVKIRGEVGAVQAAVEAATAVALKVTTIATSHVIPRPHEELVGQVIK